MFYYLCVVICRFGFSWWRHGKWLPFSTWKILSLCFLSFSTFLNAYPISLAKAKYVKIDFHFVLEKILDIITKPHVAFSYSLVVPINFKGRIITCYTIIHLVYRPDFWLKKFAVKSSKSSSYILDGHNDYDILAKFWRKLDYANT